MTEVKEAPAVAHKTCKLVVVVSGLPDAGLRIYPAEHEYEKINTGNRPGQERWEAVQQLMRQFCPRGKYVPEPMTFNPDHPRNTNVAPPADSELPLVTLDGAVLQAPPDQSRPKMPSVQGKEAAMDARVARLENRLDKLIDIMTESKKAEQKRGPGRPRKEDK